MTDELSRRDMLKIPLAAATAYGLTHLTSTPAVAADFAKPVPEAAGLAPYQNHSQILVRWNNHPLTVYRAHASQKYPYFYPVNGPVSGLSLTAESCLPYPHHRGLWLGCDPLNGGNYWSDGPLEQGQIRSVGLKLGEADESTVSFTDRCEWIRKDAPSPMKDERRFLLTRHQDRLWTIDIDFQLTACQDVSVKRAKHSLFAIRAAADISPSYGGILINSEGGKGAEGTYGKEAKWCGYYGKRASHPDVVEGISIMTHPENPWRPVWFTREYGHLSPSPFNFLDTPWTLAEGKSITLKYRVALHAGSPQEADLNAVYRQWIDAG